MGVTPKQAVAFFFGAVHQARSRRGLRQGELIEAVNVRQVKEDEYRKRPGFDRVVPTPESGTFSTGESLISDGKGTLARDANDNVWYRDGSTWRSRGRGVRSLPTVSPGKLVANAARPVSVVVGTSVWVFTLGTNFYSYTIFAADGTVTRAPTVITATGIAQLAAETDSTNVWVIWITGTNTTMTSHKFVVSSPGTAPVSATYRTTANIARGVDMFRLSGTGEIAVACSERAAGTAQFTVSSSYLNTSTGQAKAAPAAVTSAAIGGGGHLVPSVGQPSILTSDGSNGSWYYAAWGTRSGFLGHSLYLVTVNAATLATSAVSLVDIPSGGASAFIGWCCGYLAGNGDRVVFGTDDPGTSSTQPRPYVLTRYTYNGATTSTVIRRYSYPVSKPVAAPNGTFYLVTGYDDGPTANFIKSYFLVDSDGNIASQIAYGQAAAAGLRADPAITVAEGFGFVTPLRLYGTSLVCSLLYNTGSGGGSASVNDFAPALVSCDFSAAYSAPAKGRDGIALWPGGVPVRAGSADNQRELALMLSPVNMTFTAGAGAAHPSATTVQYLYRMVDADGTIYRSAPSPAQTQIFNVGGGSAVTVKPLTHMMPGATAQIELYMSTVGSTEPFLQTVVDNDPTVDTITINVTPASIVANETIYTFGGGIENTPVPPSRSVCSWRNRTIVAAGSEIWPSLEQESGLGPRFNEAYVTTWDDGEGDILAVAPVDWNYCAVFKRNAIGIISGAGPNPTAGGGVSGNYEVQTLRPRKGLVNARSVVTGPQGAYFQSLADFRIYCVTGLDVIDVSQGMEDYRTETVTATNFVEKDRQIHFHMDSGAVMVLDYAHPTPEQPAGRWVRWTSSGLARAAGATIDTSGVPIHLERISGAIRTPGTGWQDATSTTPVDVLMKLTTGDLAAAGQLRGEYRLDAVHVQGEWLAANTMRVTVASDFGTTSTTHTTASLTAGPQEAYIRPNGHARVQSTKVTVEETVSAGEGFIFQGIVLTIQPRGRSKFPGNTQRVT